MEEIMPIEIEDEMKHSYLDYAMSVIIGRAIPDVRDGLKPVHRRILYAMWEAGNRHSSPYKKSARIVGEVIGKFHPHGDAAVYDALVRMAQDFAMRYPLVDGQGNFGSIDGDAPAAMRYTEVRMSRIAEEMLADIDKETVDFVPNYDTTVLEPVVLPTKIPNLFINGSSGIAVGMATRIPPHNLSEVIDGIIHLIDNPQASIHELMEFIKGPDFPTYGIIAGLDGIKSAYETGKGSIIVRGRAHIEEERGKPRIVITELPYEVNKAKLLTKIAQLVQEKRIEGITDIRDESDRKGIRVVIELKRDENPERILNLLYKHTQLQISYGVILLAIVNLKPRIMNLKEILNHFISHRRAVVIRRSRYELRKAEERLHILEGLLIAISNIDEVVAIIKRSKNVDIARAALMKRFKLTRIQAQAILEMQLQKLTGLERDKLEEEQRQLIEKVKELREILASRKALDRVIKTELKEIKKKYGDERRTEILPYVEEVADEELIPKRDYIVILTSKGYLKKKPISYLRVQKRGGKGRNETIRKEDVLEKVIVANSHSLLLFFTDKGKVYGIKTYEIPDTGERGSGKHISHLLSLDKDEKVKEMLSLKDVKGDNLILITKNGMAKRSELSEYVNVKRNGKIAINLREGDEVVAVFTDSGENVFVATRKGMSITFPANDLRIMGRTATGVKAIKLKPGDEVVSADTIRAEHKNILVVTSLGYGKKTPIGQYKVQSRGGIGIKNVKLSSRTGEVVSSFPIDSDLIVLITRNGKIIKIKSRELREMGRATQGVRLVKLDEGDEVVDAEKLRREKDEATQESLPYS
ncbi:MAG: DNA gyrase subunit A [Candidatus Aminicenantes bacterium]|nr:DNA gyrase subunit A [Candidatus Aminicenantes bacterium]